MRSRLAVVLLVVGSPACGAGEQPAGDAVVMQRYGISLEVPAGWDAALTRGVVRLAGPAVTSRLLEREVGPDIPPAEADALFRRVERVPRLSPNDFRAPEPGTSTAASGGRAQRAFSLSGRLFVLIAESDSRPADADDVAVLNAALGSIEIRPGDFYDGTVEPARFAQRDGWHTGTTGPAEVQAHGESAWSWAATIPWEDEPRQLPPHETLERLPPDGIAINVWLDRSSAFAPRPHDTTVSRLRLEGFDHRTHWEDRVRDVPEYVLWARARGGYQLDVRVYFGRADPTPAMLAEAQAMLDGLRLPDWGPWDVDG